MTLLRKTPGNSSTATVRNYTINSSATGNIIAATGKTYTEGAVHIRNTTDSLIFNYTINNFNNVLRTSIYAMIGEEFDIDITDFSSGSDIGLTITNNEPTALEIAIIQQL